MPWVGLQCDCGKILTFFLVYKPKGSAIILGDFSARIRSELDFISDGDDSLLNENYALAIT